MIRIYHNPRCRKSREGIAILEKSGKEFQIVKYLDDPLSYSQLEGLLSKLNVEAMDLVRKTELIWKENFKGKSLTDRQIINAMVKYPKLIERPIVEVNDNAVIGRPPENIKSLF